MDAVVDGFHLTEALYEGAWSVYRGHRDGVRALVTILPITPHADEIEALALPFDGIPPLLRTTRLDGERFAMIEREPGGWTIAELKWPLPIDEVVRIGLDLARVLARMHAAGAIHGSLRPQTTWIDKASHLTGTTPRPERIALGWLARETRTGVYSPFLDDMFYPDVLARGEPASQESDSAQLGMMLHRMATHESPFAKRPDDAIFQPMLRAIEGDIPRWKSDDPRSREVEALARAAFDPAQRTTRSLATLTAGLERLA